MPPAVVAAACVLCVLACAWALWRWWPRGQPDAARGALVVDGPSVVAEVTDTAVSATPAKVIVHVVGAVRRPGVYELVAGSRVSDAVEAAGGMLAGAVAAGVNLARPVTDGEQIVVPDEDGPVANPAAGGATNGAGASGAGPIDINSADAAALDALPGVGPSTAAKIIAEREANGPFSSVEDLARVSGIGPKKLEQLAGLACVR